MIISVSSMIIDYSVSGKNDSAPEKIYYAGKHI